MKKEFYCCVLVFFFFSTLSFATENYCPQLPLNSNYNIINVNPSQATSLDTIVYNAPENTTILLEDGIYYIDNQLNFNVSNVELRSASSNRDSVIIDGQYNVGTIVSIRASNITIADLTIKQAYYHPIHIAGGGDYAKIYNLHIIDGREQQIKINPSGTTYNDFGEVACNLIEWTDIGREYHQTHLTPGYICYTGGMDFHQAWGWTVRDNEIKNIYCNNSGVAEHGIHFWDSCRDAIVERNKVINCTRGIGFGLGETSGGKRIYPDNPLAGTGLEGQETYVGHIGGVIKNNLIYADIGIYYDSGIGLEQAWNVSVYHNTIYSEHGSFNVAIDSRWSNSNPLIQNNLYYPQMVIRNYATPTYINNTRSNSNMFVNVLGVNFNLVNDSLSISNQGELIPSVSKDILGNSRNNPADLGAYEYVSEQIYNEYDSNNNHLIDTIELLNIVDRWIREEISMVEVFNYLNKWKRRQKV